MISCLPLVSNRLIRRQVVNTHVGSVNSQIFFLVMHYAMASEAMLFFLL